MFLGTGPKYTNMLLHHRRLLRVCIDDGGRPLTSAAMLSSAPATSKLTINAMSFHGHIKYYEAGTQAHSNLRWLVVH